MAKRGSNKRLNVYSNLSRQRKVKKDTEARRHAEYLASLPKHPVKRMLFRMHPKRLAAYWFSKRGLKMAIKVTGVAVLLCVLLVGGLFAYYRKDLDQIRPEALRERVRTTVTKYYDRNNVLLWEDKGSGNYTIAVDGKDIAKTMKQATVAIEDKDFYHHGAISISGMMRAAINNSQGDSVQGGSTLTQQLVKQVYFSDEAGLRGISGIPRKIKEVILSIEVERMYSKEQILNLYLNESPYGGRRNGVESAAETYFGKKAKDLTLAESALLAAIPNQPGLYDPYNKAGNTALVARQHKVLDKMVEQRYITQAQADEAKKVRVLDELKPESEQFKGAKAMHFVEYVRSQLEASLGKATVGKGGLVVKTTLDYRIQKNLEQNMNEMFSSYIPAYAGFSNGAGEIEDVRTGQILAMMGSRDYNYPGFGQDNAAISYLQPGSSVKPLVYAKLFEDKGQGAQNFGSGSILSDVQTNFGGNPPYIPQNATRNFLGNISIRKSLDLSRNIPAIKAMAINGVNPTLEFMRQMGDTNYCTQGSEKDAGLSSAIGGCGTRMIDHVNALASLARLGVYMPYSTVLEVKDGNGQVLQKYTPQQKRIIDPQAPYIVNDILGDSAVRNGLYGRSITPDLDAAGIKVAVKTGTSNGTNQYGQVMSKDIWTTMYSPSLSIAVWLGNNDTKLLPNGLSAYASLVADPAMTYASQLYYKDGKAKQGEWFKEPAGIQHIGGELYPSYYNKASSSNAQLTFDKVSKKKATNCTPADAQVKVAVAKTVDPFSKKAIYIAPDGYDATKDDDVHKCDDVKPTISGINVTNDRISVQVVQGTFTLNNLTISVNGRPITTKNISGSGTYAVNYTSTGKVNVSATVNDSAFYSGTGSTTYTATNSGGTSGNSGNSSGGSTP